MSAPHPPKPSPNSGEGAERRRREAGEGSRPNRIARARALRAEMTDAERKLWFALRDRRLGRVKFRRQVPIGPFVADFLCYSARLVIEVDGGQHAESRRDERRDRWFAANSFRVLRFWNNDVLSNVDGVLTVIIDAVHAAGPHPDRAARCRPSPELGEGKEEIAG